MVTLLCATSAVTRLLWRSGAKSWLATSVPNIGISTASIPRSLWSPQHRASGNARFMWSACLYVQRYRPLDFCQLIIVTISRASVFRANRKLHLS
jgi:hypothetical protein